MVEKESGQQITSTAEKKGKEPFSIDRRDFIKGSIVLTSLLYSGDLKEAAAFLDKELIVNGGLKEKTVKPEFEFFYSYHFRGADKRGLSEKIKNASVFAPEALGWNDDYLTMFRGVSEGKISPSEIAKKFGLREDPRLGSDSSLLRTLRALYNSKVRVEFLDPPAGHPVAEESINASVAFGEIDIMDKDFSRISANFKEKLMVFSAAQVTREAYILERLKSIAREIQNGDPGYIKKGNVANILIAFGAAHTTLSHAMFQAENEVKRSFQRMPFIFGYESEAIRRFMLGKEVTDDLASRALVERVTVPMMLNYLPGFESHQKVAFIRKVIKVFSGEDLRILFAKMQEALFDHRFCSQILKEMSRERGVDFPQTKEALERALS